MLEKKRVLAKKKRELEKMRGCLKQNKRVEYSLVLAELQHCFKLEFVLSPFCAVKLLYSKDDKSNLPFWIRACWNLLEFM